MKKDDGVVIDRQLVELNVRIALTQMAVIVASVRNEVVVGYEELYMGQTRGYNVSRIYYAVRPLFFLTVFFYGLINSILPYSST